MIEQLLRASRSYRRFHENEHLPLETLHEWVALTRFCPSGRNIQPLRYRPVIDRDICDSVFATLSWAGYLEEWDGPAPGERPSAYLVQLLDTHISADCLCDDGIQLQTILLAATEQGFGGCIVKAFNRAALGAALSLPPHLRVLHVLALGRPAEKVVIEEMNGDDYRYWRTPDGTHHVPKRPLADLLA
jgi:nitroreductase